MYAFNDPQEEEDNARANNKNINSQDYYDAFLRVLSAVWESEIKYISLSSGVRCLIDKV